ncbi:MAG TPA: hypothetical protein VFV27_08260 [Nevskiaceae bacterium]|nr:hypothetical protein [Nevskiaceae bacterium]
MRQLSRYLVLRLYELKIRGIELLRLLRLRCLAPEARICSYRGLLELAREQARSRETCHIVAAGWSATGLERAGCIGERDYVIGMNHSAFMPLRFDLYFVEIADGRRVSRIQRRLLRKTAADRIGLLVYKNLWHQDRRSIAGAARWYGSSALFSMDVMAALIDNEQLEDMVDRMLGAPGLFMEQRASTAISAAVAAFHLGFRRIVVHGVDFGGSHFYVAEAYRRASRLPSPFPATTGSHTASAYPNGQQVIWPVLIRALAARGVRVYAGSPQSPFADLAPVFAVPS